MTSTSLTAPIGLTRPSDTRRERSRPKTGRMPCVHLVGVCGSGMRALAEVLADLGYRVSGSDRQLDERPAQLLARRGVSLVEGHAADTLPPGLDLLIYSPAVPESNPERAWARRNGIAEVSYTEMLGRLMQGKTGVSIAGTHGKSTTTAMTGSILTAAGLHPTVIVGAESCGLNSSGWSGDGEHVVVESCEFQRNFLALHPELVALTGIEFDHADCFTDLADVTGAFREFVERVPASGVVLRSATCEASRAACAGIAAPVETVGLQSGATWWAGDVRTTTSGGSRFRLFHGEEYVCEVSLQVAGRHNVFNAVFAGALAAHAGATAGSIREGLEEFAGLRRRFENVGQWRGVTLIDDYAHHPTAVAATLATARERYPGRRVFCLFQPHQVSRTKSLLSEFASSLRGADRSFVVPIFAAREEFGPEHLTCAEQLAAEARRLGCQCEYEASLDRIKATLDDALHPGDVLITMGAGDIGHFQHAFHRQLSRHHFRR